MTNAQAEGAGEGGGGGGGRGMLGIDWAINSQQGKTISPNRKN